MKNNDKTIGFLSLIFAAIAFGSFGIWIRLLNEYTTIYQQIVMRNVIAMIFAVLFIILGKRFIFNFKKINKFNLLSYGLVVPISVIFYNIGVLNIKIAVATFAFYGGSILFSQLLSIIFYKEKITLIKIISLISVLGGLICFTWPLSIAYFNIGFLASFFSGLLDAAANGFRKNLADKIDKFILVFITTLGGVLVSGLMMIYFKQNFNFITTIPMSNWLIFSFFGFLLAGVNYLLLIGFQKFDLSLGSIVLASELVFTIAFGYFVFKEFPSLQEIIGGIFILIAIILPNCNLSLFKLKQKTSK